MVSRNIWIKIHYSSRMPPFSSLLSPSPRMLRLGFARLLWITARWGLWGNLWLMNWTGKSFGISTNRIANNGSINDFVRFPIFHRFPGTILELAFLFGWLSMRSSRELSCYRSRSCYPKQGAAQWNCFVGNVAHLVQAQQKVGSTSLVLWELSPIQPWCVASRRTQGTNSATLSRRQREFHGKLFTGRRLLDNRNFTDGVCKHRKAEWMRSNLPLVEFIP